MVTFSVREEILEVISKLFIYTDNQDWKKLQAEVFSDDVLFDMSSLGGVNAETTSKTICETWRKGFEGIDSVNHLAGNHLIHINDIIATVFVYATATHYKESATRGKTREFVGTYDISLMKHGIGWRIYQFKYNLKFMTGNADMV